MDLWRSGENEDHMQVVLEKLRRNLKHMLTKCSTREENGKERERTC